MKKSGIHLLKVYQFNNIVQELGIEGDLSKEEVEAIQEEEEWDTLVESVSL